MPLRPLSLSKYPAVDLYLSEVIYRQHFRKSKVTSCDSASADIYKLLTHTNLFDTDDNQGYSGTGRNIYKLDFLPSKSEVVVLIDLLIDEDTEIHSLVAYKEEGENWKILQAYGDAYQEKSVLELLKHSQGIVEPLKLIRKFTDPALNEFQQNMLYHKLCGGSLPTKIRYINWQVHRLKKELYDLEDAYKHNLNYISIADDIDDEIFLTDTSAVYQDVCGSVVKRPYSL